VAENEFYRQTIVIDVQGDEAAKKSLKAMDNYLESSRKRAKSLDKTKVSPKVTLADKITKPLLTIKKHLYDLKGVKKITITAVDKASGVIGRIAKRVLSPIAVFGLAAGLTAATALPLKLAGEMEQANIAMTTMLGNQKLALKFQKELTKFAIKTPFEMPELRDITKRMLAFGFASEKVIPMLTAIGNASSGLGLGSEGMGRITLALGQMRAKSKVSAQEMMQLTETGIPAWEILAKKMGKSTAEVMKLTERGLIPADKAINMLVSGMNQRFPDMMAKQSRSLFGLTSTIKDFVNLKLFTSFGEGIRRSTVPAMQRLVDMLEKNGDKVDRIEKLFFKLGETVGNTLVNGIENAYKWFDKISSDETFKKLDVTGKLGFIIGKAASDLAPVAVEAGIKLGQSLAAGIISGTWSALKSSMSFKNMWENSTKVFGWDEKGRSNLSKMAFDSNMFGIKSLGDLYNNAGQWVGQGSKNTPKKHALGGIFNRPHLGMVAEEGREGLIPLAPGRRNRALSLWYQVGDQLGAESSGKNSSGNTGVYHNTQKISVSVAIHNTGQPIDEEVIANRVAMKVAKKLGKVFENKAIVTSPVLS
jgi:tape measure domain-containing protein